MDNERIAPHDALGIETSASPLPVPRSPRPILLPLVALLLATLVTQLGSLPYIMGRAEQAQGATLQSPLYMVTVVVISVSVLTIPLAGLGLRLGGQVGLGAPLLTGLLERHPVVRERLHRDAMLAVPLGLGVGVVLALLRMVMTPYLPPELTGLKHPGALEGILASAGAAVAEETWLRLGLMTLLAWPVARFLGHAEIQPIVAWPANVVAALAFGMMHLPQLANLGGDTPTAIVGTLFGNGIVGVLCGWLYWRRSLVAAVLAHFAVDMILHVLAPLAMGT